jgi:hypothetical protein
MEKILSILAKVALAIALIIYVLCLIAVVYVLYVRLGMLIWQIVIVLGIIILIPGGIIYMLVRANRNNSLEDQQRERQIMDDITDIREGKYRGIKTGLGKWYLAAFIFIVAFPILARIIGSFVSSPDLELNVVLGIGWLFILSFIGAMIWKRYSK